MDELPDVTYDPNMSTCSVKSYWSSELLALLRGIERNINSHELEADSSERRQQKSHVEH